MERCGTPLQSFKACVLDSPVGFAFMEVQQHGLDKGLITKTVPLPHCSARPSQEDLYYYVYFEYMKIARVIGQGALCHLLCHAVLCTGLRVSLLSLFYFSPWKLRDILDGLLAMQ